jgi:hypothetical protein
VLFRKRTRLRPLSERECYLRLHGRRSGEIEVLRHRPEPKVELPPAMPSPPPLGPTDPRPALHLVFAYPRGGGTLTGEQLRLELLRRMQARAGEAA